MKAAISAFFIASISLGAGAALAQQLEAKTMSRSAESCLEEAKTAGAVSHCLGIEQGRQENRVDTAYGKLFAARDENGRIALRADQRQWEESRADHCRSKSRGDLDFKECLALTAKARAEHLERITAQARR